MIHAPRDPRRGCRARTVFLRGFDARGWVFYTNYELKNYTCWV
jgi:pyridoxine/pyridoxamine 5'-phosphate oxidase